MAPPPHDEPAPMRDWAFPILWTVFCGTLATLVRWGTGAGVALPALCDEVAVCASLLAGFGIFRRRGNLVWGHVPIVVCGCILTLGTLSNELYHRTFGAWVGLHTLGAFEELDDVQSSIASLLEPELLLVWGVLPLSLLYGLRRSWRGWAPQGLRWWALLAFSATILGSATRDNVAAPHENHYLLSAIRLEVRQFVRSQGHYDPAGVLEGTSIESLLPAMAGYTRPGSIEQPLLQIPTEVQGPRVTPNIIVIEAESVRSAESGAYGAPFSLTPSLDRLATEGLRAQNFYAQGIQTIRGELSTLCSTFPALGTTALYKREPDADLTCLPEILGQAGYENHWFSAYRSNYAGKRAFLEQHGFDVVLGVEDHRQPDDVSVGWGISDHEMGDRILDLLDGASEPFLATWITLSNHHPWDWDYPLEFPDELALGENPEPYDHYRRGVYYTDAAIGHFVDELRQRPWGREAWIVIVGDHGMHIFPEETDRTDLRKLEAHFRVPFLLLAPGLVKPRVLSRTASQIDIAPTLLELLGARVPNTFVGQDMLRPPDAPPSPALLVGENAASLILDGERCMVAAVTCYEDAQPQCSDGEVPAPASHACFHSQGALLFQPHAPMRPLPPNRSAELRQRLALIPELQSHLEAHDRLGAGTGWLEALPQGVGQQ